MTEGSNQTTPAAVEALVKENLALADRLARRYSHGHATDEDLGQVALLGLLLAARRYDPAAGDFRPYAVATISGELKKHLRNHGWAVRVSRRLQEQTVAVERVISALTQSLQRSPTPLEVAEAAGLTTEDVLAALRATNARFGGELPMHELSTGLGDECVIDLTNRLDLEAALSLLPPDDVRLLRMRYVDELTQRQMADELEISQPNVHRRLERLHLRLRTILASHEAEPG